MALLIETALTAAMNSADIAEPNGHEGGFSLIEVLVALVLLSVIAGLMTGFMGQFRILKRVQSENAAQLEVEALAGFLGESISGAMPLHLIDQNLERRFPLEGERDHVRFTGLTSKGMAARQLREISFSLTGNAERQDLVEILSPSAIARTRHRSWVTSICSEVTLRLSFRYLEPAAADGATRWLDSWGDQPGLPAAIEISLTARRGGQDVSATKRAILKFAVASHSTP
jgi:prepilin-type N-terminal cleavage/methylation domain-containing protein